MSLLALPPELFQQILSETATFENFTSLRLVHPHFDNIIRTSAEYLMKGVVRAQNVSDHVFSLHQQYDRKKTGTELLEQQLSSLLRLHKNVATCIRLERVLDAHREKFAAFPIWADVPAKGFGSIESVLIFSAFQRELIRSVQAQDESQFSGMIARADASNDHFEWLKLDQRFMDFIRDQLTVDDLQALMTIVNFCAISTRFIDTILTSRYYFNDAGASDHWQNEQLGSALLAERILWRGPSWLAKMLCQSIQSNAPAIVVQQNGSLDVSDDHTMWTGSRAEAARLAANGIARFLWKERALKLELEQRLAETSGVEMKPLRPDLRVDAAVWRGSSGG